MHFMQQSKSILTLLKLQKIAYHRTSVDRTSVKFPPVKAFPQPIVILHPQQFQPRFHLVRLTFSWAKMVLVGESHVSILTHNLDLHVSKTLSAIPEQVRCVGNPRCSIPRPITSLSGRCKARKRSEAELSVLIFPSC